jgi:hypothetical protein
MTIIRYALLFLTFLFAHIVGVAQASYFYDYNSTCVSECDVVGLNNGDPVSGFVEFGETNFASNAILDTTDILAFSITDGNVNVSNSTSIGWWFTGGLESNGVEFSFFALSASEALDPARGDYINAGWQSGFASPSGACSDSTPLCQSFTWDKLGEGEVGLAQFNAGTLVRRDIDIPQVPVPAAFWLFGTALIGFVGLSRRRKVA